MSTGAETACSSPILNIPDEILCYVFLIVFETSRSTVNQSKRGRYKFKDRGVLVTHVCRHWRSVALDYAPIWTNIMADVYNLEQIGEYLVRSKSMLLTMHVSMDRIGFNSAQFGMPSIQEIITPHLSRVQDLTISGYNLAKSLRKPQFFIYSAVNVRSLKLESTCCSEIWFPEYFDGLLGPPSVQDSMRKFPRLGELHLHVVRPQAMLPWMNTLTRLCLQNQFVEAGALVKVLEQCSERLEYLKLSRVRIEASKSIPASQKVVDLRNIQDTVFISNMGFFTSVFPYLKLPEETSWLVVDYLCIYQDPVEQLRIHLNSMPTPLLVKNAYLEIQVLLQKKELNFIICDAASGMNGTGIQQDYEIRVSEEFWPRTVQCFFSNFPKYIPSELQYLEILFSGYTMDSPIDYDFEMDLLEPITHRSRNIYFLKFSFQGGGKEDNIDIQVRLMTFLLSLDVAVIWPNAKVLCFKHFDFSTTNFWNQFLLLSSIWKKLGRTVRIDEPFSLSDKSACTLRDRAGDLI